MHGGGVTLGGVMPDGPVIGRAGSHWPEELAMPPPRLKKPGKLANSVFFLIQAACLQGFSGKTEFANRGKLSGKLAKSFWQPRGDPCRHAQEITGHLKVDLRSMRFPVC